MQDDKLWVLTVVAGLSVLVILAYLVTSPLSSESGTIKQVENGLEAVVNKFDTIRADPEYDLVTESDSNT